VRVSVDRSELRVGDVFRWPCGGVYEVLAKSEGKHQIRSRATGGTYWRRLPDGATIISRASGGGSEMESKVLRPFLTVAWFVNDDGDAEILFESAVVAESAAVAEREAITVIVREDTEIEPASIKVAALPFG